MSRGPFVRPGLLAWGAISLSHSRWNKGSEYGTHVGQSQYGPTGLQHTKNDRTKPPSRPQVWIELRAPPGEPPRLSDSQSSIDAQDRPANTTGAGYNSSLHALTTVRVTGQLRSRACWNQISLALAGDGLAPSGRRLETFPPTVLLLKHGDALESGGCAELWVSPAIEKGLFICVLARERSLGPRTWSLKTFAFSPKRE